MSSDKGKSAKAAKKKKSSKAEVEEEERLQEVEGEESVLAAPILHNVSLTVKQVGSKLT